ncbi:MAG: hypothetical protein ACLTGI_03405 [Hoylesella buccalis]
MFAQMSTVPWLLLTWLRLMQNGRLGECGNPYAKIAAEGGSDKVTEPARGWDIGQADILWGYDINSQNSTLWASYWSHMGPFLGSWICSRWKNKTDLQLSVQPDSEDRLT